MSNPIDLDSKYMWAISNADIDATKNLGLTIVKKYQRHTGQIKEKVNGLYKDQIPAFALFVKHCQKMYNNEKVTENIKIRQEVNLK